MTTVKEIRAGLAQTSADDLEGVYAWYLKSRDLLLTTSGDPGRASRDLDVTETARRAERLLGQAFKSGKERGVLLYRGRRPKEGGAAKPITNYLSYGEGLSQARRFAATPEEVFESAIAKCRADGKLSRTQLATQIIDLCGADPLKHDVQERKQEERQLRATARGRRTIEHMAIQLDAIARGVEELDPQEIDRRAMHPVINRVYGDIAVIRSFLRKVNTK